MLKTSPVKTSPVKTSPVKTSPKKVTVPPIVYIFLGGITLLAISRINPGFKPPTKPAPTDLVNSPIGPTHSLISAVPNVPTGTYRYGGSTSWATIRREVDATIRLNFPKFQPIYTNPEIGEPSSERGLEMLIEGKLDFVQSSQGIPIELRKRAEQAGIKLKEIPVAIDAIAIVVHPSLNIPGLTLAQIEAIKSGKITNWLEVGGPDLAIQIYSKDGAGVSTSFIPIVNSTDAFRKVSQDAGAFYSASASLAVPQCGVKTLPISTDGQTWIAPHQLPLVPALECSQQRHNQVNLVVFQAGKYPLLRSLTVVVPEDGTRRQQAGESYAEMLLTDQGQELIRKAGYSNVR